MEKKKLAWGGGGISKFCQILGYLFIIAGYNMYFYPACRAKIHTGTTGFKMITFMGSTGFLSPAALGIFHSMGGRLHQVIDQQN